MRFNLSAFGVLGAMALAAGSAFADQAVLFPSADNTLYIHETGDLSNGSGTSMFVGVNRQGFTFGARRAVMKFDIAGSIPAGATITQVDLSIYVSRARGSTYTVGLYPLLASWGESTSHAGDSSGGSGDLAAPGDATWIHRFASNTNPVFWNTPGGDFSPISSANASVGTALGRYSWASNAALIANVQSWLNNPDQNFGWLMKSNELGSSQVRRIGTREAVVNERPLLTIQYTVPSPATAGVLVLGGVVGLRRRR